MFDVIVVVGKLAIWVAAAFTSVVVLFLVAYTLLHFLKGFIDRIGETPEETLARIEWERRYWNAYARAMNDTIKKKGGG